jgi:hypothetical protein
MYAIEWDIRRHGRAWSGDEAEERWQLTPEKFEMHDGRLFFDDEQRLLLLGLLLENCGADAAVRLGRPDVWRAAVAALDAQR